MSVEEMAEKYIRKTERALRELKIYRKSIRLSLEEINEVIDEAKRYLEDAKYYLDKKQSGTSLASVAYCEGLLDALRMMGLVKFDWQVLSRKMEKNKKRTVVLASGAFDLLHYGHVYYLTNAKKAGGENAKLVVIVAKDKTVEKLKGKKPIIPEDQRRALVESLKVVDEAILGYENMDMLKVIEKVKPDVIALGYDEEKIERKLKKLVEEKNLKIKIVRIDRFQENELVSSSKIKRKIIEDYHRNLN